MGRAAARAAGTFSTADTAVTRWLYTPAGFWACTAAASTTDPLLDWSVVSPAAALSEGEPDEALSGGMVIGSGAVVPNQEKGEVLVVRGTAMMRPPM